MPQNGVYQRFEKVNNHHSLTNYWHSFDIGIPCRRIQCGIVFFYENSIHSPKISENLRVRRRRWFNRILMAVPRARRRDTASRRRF